VLTSTRTSAPTLGKAATLAALGLLLTGCAGGLGSGAGLAGLQAGETAIRVTNHVAAPGELDRITITVDGEPVALSSIPPQSAPSSPSTSGPSRRPSPSTSAPARAAPAPPRPPSR